jgi:hypothetical protein
MAALSAAALLAAWEQVRSVPSPQRAAALLRATGLPSQPSIGSRDAVLLAAYAENFSARLDGLAACPRCETEVELSVPVAELLSGVGAAAPVEPIEMNGVTVHWRLPDEADLAAVADYDDAEEAARVLVARCIVSGIAVGAVTEDLRRVLAERIAAADPYADITFAMACPECGQLWESGLDIGPFLWSALRIGASSLLREVHQLATAYGWSEAEILALPRVRRETYLDMVRHG